MSDIFDIDIKWYSRFLKKNLFLYKFASKTKSILVVSSLPFLLPFLIAEILFYIIKNKNLIFKNKLILPFYHWSFGHQIIGYDYYSRLYYPNKISLILIFHKRNNPFLNLCFQNFECFIFKSKIIRNSNNFICGIIKKLFILILNFFSLFRDIFILNQFSIYKTLNNPRAKILKNYNKSKNDFIDYDSNLTGYYFLIKNKIGVKPSLNSKITQDINSAILKYYPNFKINKFVCLLLRKSRSLNYYDSFRDAGDQSRFVKSIKQFSDNGYSIVASGETDENIFRDIPGFISSDKINRMNNMNYHILNLFFLLNCRQLICQHSGPYIICNSANIPCTIVDSFPFFHGSYNPDDKIMLKKISYKGKILSLDELLNNHKFVFYGKCNKEDGYDALDSTEDEIYKTIFEENYSSINFFDDMLIKHTENKKIYYWG